MVTETEIKIKKPFFLYSRKFFCVREEHTRMGK